jgi:acetyltransferase-like isoleucine patch superfamily enzyme
LFKELKEKGICNEDIVCHMKFILVRIWLLINKLQHVILIHCCDLEALLDYPPNAKSRRLFLRCYLKVKRVHFQGPIWTGAQFRIFGSGDVSIGARCAIGNFSSITAHGAVNIGDDFLCSSHLVVNSGTHDVLTRQPYQTHVLIGNNVWVGTRVTIIGDTEIGDNCVVAAGALVRGAFPPNSVLGGVPAKVLKTLESPPADFWRFFCQSTNHE